MVEPLVSRLVLRGGTAGSHKLRALATTLQETTVSVLGTGAARVEVYDGRGRRVSHTVVRPPAAVPVLVVNKPTVVRR